jgi:hypothetical protein
VDGMVPTVRSVCQRGDVTFVQDASPASGSR